LGFENCEIMERVHLKFCKILLQLNHWPLHDTWCMGHSVVERG
jgi:hypothetical protein